MFLGLGVVLLIVGVVLLAMGSKEKVKTSGKYKAMMGMGGFLLVTGIGLAVYGAMSGGGGGGEGTAIDLEGTKAKIQQAPDVISTDAIVEQSMMDQSKVTSQIQSNAQAKIAVAQNAANKQVANASKNAQANAAAQTTKLQQNLALVQTAADAHKHSLGITKELAAQKLQIEAAGGLK